MAPAKSADFQARVLQSLRTPRIAGRLRTSGAELVFERVRAPGAESAFVWLRARSAELAFAGLLGLGAAIALIETSGVSFYFDDWDFVLHRGGLSADVLLRPHGPHLMLIPVVIYKVLLSVFGGKSYLPFLLAGVLLGGAFWVTARR